MKEPQYIIDTDGNHTAVVLDLASYHELLERLAAAEDPRRATTTDNADGPPSQMPDPSDEAHRPPSLVGTSGADLVALLQTLTFDPAGLDEMERIIAEDCERIDPRDW